MKRKSAAEVTENFEKILHESGRVPKYLQTDEDRAFLSNSFKTLLKKHNVKLFHTKSELKASIVERFQKTIIQKIYKLFTLRNHFRYINDLNNLVTTYNNTHHRSINMPPAKVSNQNKRILWLRQHCHDVRLPKNSKLKIGDTVRISKHKTLFTKSYLPNFSEEVFTITHKYPGSPITFSLADLSGQALDGVFYEEELTKFTINKQTEFLIEKVLKRRKNKVLVKWKGYPASFNSWVSRKNLKQLAKNGK